MFSEYGLPETLEPAEIGHAEPAAGQIRVSVRAAGVQPFDCALCRGDLARWMPVPLPSRLGNESAGTVKAVGAGVTSVAAGDEVLGWQERACYAEQVTVPVGQIVAKPSGVPWEHAGVLSASGETAHIAIATLAVGPGDILLVHAAAGGVGSFAVQIAAALDATVIGTARPANHDYLRSLGAIPVTYGDDLEAGVRAVAAKGVTAVLDCAGGPALEQPVNLAADPARIVTIADRANAPPRHPGHRHRPRPEPADPAPQALRGRKARGPHPPGLPALRRPPRPPRSRDGPRARQGRPRSIGHRAAWYAAAEALQNRATRPAAVTVTICASS